MDLERRIEAEQLYSAAVGRKAAFYVPKFIGFDTYDSARLSWNWPAFFFTFPWMLYRRMYGYAAVYFVLVPIVAWVLFGLISLALPPELAPFFALMLLALVFFVAPPAYANAMYHTTIAGRIHEASTGASTLDEQIQALTQQRSTNVIAAVLGVVLVIPSTGWSWYSRDTRAIQEEVADAIAHTGYVQSDLEQFYREHDKRWPRDGKEMALDDSAKGAFVETLEVKDGDIHVTFGGESTRKMHGKRLVMKPFIGEPFRVDWVCVEPAHIENSVPKRYWPRNCDTRDIKSPPSAELSPAPATRSIEFAGGRATVPLPETYQVAVNGDTLTATFGANRDHKLEMTFLQQIKGAERNLGARFVEYQAARPRVTAIRSDDRTVMSEPGDDIEAQGRPYELTHWQIGAGDCVFTMTLTAPLPLTNDHLDFFNNHLDTIVNEVVCVSR